MARKIGHLGGFLKELPNQTGPKQSVGYGESYDGVAYDRLPKFEQAKRDAAITKAMGPFLPLAIPGLAIAKAAAAVSDRKNIIYRQGKTPTKRQTGK